MTSAAPPLVPTTGLPAVTVVTGAASGIGLAVARKLASTGAKVAMLDNDEVRLQASAEALRAAGHAVRSWTCDVRQALAIKNIIADVEHSLGPIEGLASVAGILRLGALVDGSDFGAVTSLEDWRTSFDVNATGLLNLVQAVVPAMAQRKRGALVAVASNAASTPRAGMGAYAASKAACVMLTKCLGLEVAGHGIRCNVVSPGSTYTPMQEAFWGPGFGAAEVIAGDLSRHRLGIPLGRIANPDDVADAVTYLLSDQARHITMQELVIDGGATF